MFSQEQTTGTGLRRKTKTIPTEWKVQSCNAPSVSVQIFPRWLVVHASNPCRPKRCLGQLQALYQVSASGGALLLPSPNSWIKMSWFKHSWKSQPVPGSIIEGENGHTFYILCLSFSCPSGAYWGFWSLFVNALKSYILPGDQLNYYHYWTMISFTNVTHESKGNQNNMFSW